jgi:hypothetical protein
VRFRDLATAGSVVSAGKYQSPSLRANVMNILTIRCTAEIWEIFISQLPCAQLASSERPTSGIVWSRP